MRDRRETPDLIFRLAVMVDASANPGDDSVHGVPVQI